MAKFLQPSLSGGEMSPGMRGRVDLARYATSLGKARNFITKPTGGGAKRPGTAFSGRVKYADRVTRLFPFIYSTGLKYMIEAGDGYFRFWSGGSLVVSRSMGIAGISNAATAVVTSAAHGLLEGQHVSISGAKGMTRANVRTYRVGAVTTDTFELEGFDSSADPTYAGGGVASLIVEVVTPYTGAMVNEIRHTQSADVMYLVHPWVRQKELRRLAVDVFELRDFDFKRGPFRPFNSDEALVMAASGATGVVTITTNADTFDPSQVGDLIYMEEKELRGVKPWASAEKNVPVGALRRSDSKVYRAVAIPSSLGGKGTPYWVAGNVRPVHDSGRAFDGPQDVKDDGVNSYAVGVEWEFLHNTFGVARVTEYVSPTQVKAVVIEQLPGSVVGTAPTPEESWEFSGDGATVTFPLTGATSGSHLDYRVTINDVPVQSNPYYPGGGGVNGGGGGTVRPGNNGTNQQEALQ